MTIKMPCFIINKNQTWRTCLHISNNLFPKIRNYHPIHD